jgi:arylsulfatase A
MSKNQNPNIVVILADDAGVGDIGCYNQDSQIPTPNIDSIAQSGVQFTQAYAPGNVCTQTRYGLLTGRYHFRTDRRGDGVVFDYTDPIIGDEPTIQRVLSDYGYRTYCSGKWHLGIDWTEQGTGSGQFRTENIDFDAPFAGPTTQGFDRYYGIRASLDHPPYCLLEDRHVVGYPTGEKDTYYTQQRPGPESGTWDDRRVDLDFTSRALSYITEAVHSGDPFFLYLPTSAPHRPCLPSPQMQGRSGIGDRGDMVTQFDWTVGQIDQQLAALGVRDETILIVASDHGPKPATEENNHNPTNGLRGQKATLYEGGIRVPLIVRWSGHAVIDQVDTPVSLIDIFPTIGDLVEISVDDLDGRPFTPLLEGQEHSPRPILSEDGNGQRALREGEWKYIEATDEMDARLYNLRDDPTESENRAATNTSTAESLETALQNI